MTKGVRADGYATRPAAMMALAESLGVTIESVNFTMPGEWDFVTVMGADTVDGVLAMGSFAGATGVVERSLTYELFSGEQMDAAIATAMPKYVPPGT